MPAPAAAPAMMYCMRRSSYPVRAGPTSAASACSTLERIDAGGLQAVLVHGVGRHEVGVVDHEAADLAVHAFVDLEGAIGRVECLDCGWLAVGLCAQRRQALRQAGRRLGELGFPEIEALPLGEVGLLRGARVVDGVQHLLAQLRRVTAAGAARRGAASRARTAASRQRRRQRSAAGPARDRTAGRVMSSGLPARSCHTAQSDACGRYYSTRLRHALTRADGTSGEPK